MRERAMEMIREHRREYNLRRWREGGRIFEEEILPGEGGYREPPTEYVVVENPKGVCVIDMKAYKKMGIRRKKILDRGMINTYTVTLQGE